ncbi:CHIT30 chitinase [Usnea florida]
MANSTSNTTFNAKSSGNLAVYYGQSPATIDYTLEQMCHDKNVDIVVLAFMTTFFGPGGQPVINFGPATGGDPTLGAKKINATGLLDCPFLAKNITICQNLGKKVLLSLGGATGVTNFTNDAQATTFATTLWNLFGGGMTDSDMRPFGNVTVDGFDVDNEDHSTDHYNTFVSALRSTFSGDKTKQYYISGAPQCPRPDASIPLGAMQTMDFVFVQFYNNAMAGCDIGQPGFIDSLKAWSGDLSGNGTVVGNGPKLYIGAPACEACAGKGYLDPANMTSVIKSAMGAGLNNFGGVMLWDGSEAKNNTGSQGDYLQVVKSALS